MLKVALTGGIATGKSYVRARVAARGRADHRRRRASCTSCSRPASDAAAAIARRFGPAVVRPDGGIDRKALGALVFGDAGGPPRPGGDRPPPRLRTDRRLGGRAGAAPARRWILADIPLLFETRRERDFDRVVVAACPPAEQVRRVMRRDGLDEAAALARLAAQWPLGDKVRRATDVIDTGGTVRGDRPPGGRGLPRSCDARPRGAIAGLRNRARGSAFPAYNGRSRTRVGAGAWPGKPLPRHPRPFALVRRRITWQVCSSRRTWRG